MTGRPEMTGRSIGGEAPRQVRRRTGLDRLWTAPNFLSAARIALVGVYLYLLFEEGDRISAVVVLAVAGATDFADGRIARRFDQVTNLGIALDPTADRILLAAAVISMITYGAIPPWVAAAVLVREISVSAAVLYLGKLGAPRLEVSFIGKSAAFGLMVTFPLLLLGDGPGGWTGPLTLATEIALVPALALSYYSAVGYLLPAQHAFRARRASRRAGPSWGASAPGGAPAATNSKGSDAPDGRQSGGNPRIP